MTKLLGSRYFQRVSGSRLGPTPTRRTKPRYVHPEWVSFSEVDDATLLRFPIQSVIGLVTTEVLPCDLRSLGSVDILVVPVLSRVDVRENQESETPVLLADRPQPH